MMKALLQSICAVIATSSVLLAQFQFTGDVRSYREYPNRVEFILENARVNVYIYNEKVIRFRYTSQPDFSSAPSYAVIAGIPERSEFQFMDKGSGCTITTSALSVRLAKHPFRVSIYDHSMKLINADDDAFGVSFDHGEVRCFKKLLPGEEFYGLGEKTADLRKTGNEFTLWNSDHCGYTKVNDELYESIPFFYGIRNEQAYGIFFDNTYESHFNFGASTNRFYWFGAVQGEMDYYFMYGPEVKQVLSSYTALTGTMELPPLWALGYQQCRWSYFPESTVRSITNSFRSKHIPCDVLYLDIHYMDGYRVFTWDHNRFPHPAAMLGDLQKNGFKVVTIIDPGVKADTNYFAAKEGIANNLFATYPDGTLYQGEVWPSWAYFPDFTKAETRTWWGDKLSALLHDGVEGFWNDMNEPAVWGTHFPDIVQFDDQGFHADHKKIHNVYALEMAKATFDGLRRSSDTRHLILTRAGYSGIQRYAAEWTGDNVASEEHLKLACTMTQNMGLGGLPFVGTDVGGFVGDASQNLYIRWMELGVFTPFFRQHSSYGTKSKEPWAFGEDVETAVRDIINLRYTLLPFLYNEFHQAAVTGIPIMRPMFLNFQHEQGCYSDLAQYQFMLGEKLLVAPVLSETENTKHLYLPKGRWYELNTHTVYSGGRTILIDAPLVMTPLFVQEGGFIPMQDVQQYVGEKTIDQTEMLIFPSDTSSYELYEDDGISFDYKQGAYSLTKFSCRNDSTRLTISVRKAHDGYQSQRKRFLLKIITPHAAVHVFDNHAELLPAASMDAFKGIRTGYYYSPQDGWLLMKIPDTGTFEVEVQYQ